MRENDIDIEEQLENAGIKPEKHRSQHFLSSTNYISALVESGEIEKSHYVMEIGPGTGTITRKILEKEPEKIIAIEKDSNLAKYLEKEIDEETLEIRNEDILQYEIPEEVERCISNVPFQISSEILEKLGKAQIQSSLILQKELAERITKDPGNKEYSHLSLMTQYYFLPVKLQDIPSTAYYPSPDVDTSIVKLYPNKQRHQVENEEIFFHISKALFTHKMKKTRNAFVDARNILGITKSKAKKVRDEIPYSEERVINLEIKQINEIVNHLEEKGTLK